MQEELIYDKIYQLVDEIKTFNDKLLDHLYWYNAERPHYALDQKPPLSFLTNFYGQKSQMLWTHTNTCEFLKYMVYLD